MPTAAHSTVLIFITLFKVFILLSHIIGVILRGHSFYIVRLKLCLWFDQCCVRCCQICITFTVELSIQVFFFLEN